ncbi:unnamed protein product, partial [Amoebophrya sp. A25]|eukprot:GSA25T00017426001.1
MSGEYPQMNYNHFVPAVWGGEAARNHHSRPHASSSSSTAGGGGKIQRQQYGALEVGHDCADPSSWKGKNVMGGGGLGSALYAYGKSGKHAVPSSSSSSSSNSAAKANLGKTFPNYYGKTSTSTAATSALAAAFGAEQASRSYEDQYGQHYGGFDEDESNLLTERTNYVDSSAAQQLVTNGSGTPAAALEVYHRAMCPG